MHGSTNEQAAIRHAARAPLIDLRRRDARALCADFTPSVAADLVPGAGGDCERRAAALFRIAGNAGDYVPATGNVVRGKLTTIATSRQGDHASVSAIDSAPGAPRTGPAWQLDMLGGRWRIATPARLEMRRDCGARSVGGRGCVSALAVRFAAG